MLTALTLHGWWCICSQLEAVFLRLDAFVSSSLEESHLHAPSTTRVLPSQLVLHTYG